MIHDGFASYDRFEEALHQQCVAHPLRRAHDLEKTQIGRAKAFPRQVINLFKGACQVRDAFRLGQCDEALLEAAHERYVNQLLDLTERRRTDKTNATFAKHLYHHAEQWFLFLLDPTVPATSNAAEQALRGPIVNRKVWGGNRTAAGANAQAILCSVLATCKQQSRAVLRYLSETLRGFTSSIFGTSLQTNPACR